MPREKNLTTRSVLPPPPPPPPRATQDAGELARARDTLAAACDAAARAGPPHFRDRLAAHAFAAVNAARLGAFCSRARFLVFQPPLGFNIRSRPLSTDDLTDR